MSILVTGGTGYIGSHTVVELLNKNYEVIIIDNLSNSTPDVINRIKNITNKNVTVYYFDLLNEDKLNDVFKKHSIESVLHFAGHKAVGESVEQPLKYYKNNVMTTINLCKVMEKNQVFNLIFSSSATVYGIPETLPINEQCDTEAINPYGRTKLMCEEILKDVQASNNEWNITLLRYFNPVGAHPSGQLGEKPNGVPNNLMPYISQVAAGKLAHVKVYGNDYDTKDGSGIRDYIHVVDLALGHIAALEKMTKLDGIETFNLGTGQGYSVLEVINAFEKASGVSIPFKICERREGDAAISYADPSKANKLLNWQAEKVLYDMCKDSWRWESKVQLV